MSPENSVAVDASQGIAIPRADQPLRIAVIGGGRAGGYHLERLGLRPDFQVSRDLVKNSEELAEREIEGRNGLKSSSSPYDVLIHNDALDAVLIAVPVHDRARLAIAALGARKHTIVESPLCGTTAEFDCICDSARRSGRVLSVISSRTETDDYRMALSAVRSGEIGRVTAARLMIWGLSISDASQNGTSAFRDDRQEPSDVLALHAGHHLGQLLNLVVARPTSVFAYVAPHDAARPQPAFSILVQFEAGQSGLIERNLHAEISVHTGWLIDGTGGAYHNGRRYTLAESGEIRDKDVNPAPVAWDEVYDALIAEVQAGKSVSRSALAEGRVIQVLEAAARSASQNAVVPINVDGGPKLIGDQA